MISNATVWYEHVGKEMNKTMKKNLSIDELEEHKEKHLNYIIDFYLYEIMPKIM